MRRGRWSTIKGADSAKATDVENSDVLTSVHGKIRMETSFQRVY